MQLCNGLCSFLLNKLDFYVEARLHYQGMLNGCVCASLNPPLISIQSAVQAIVVGHNLYD